MLLPERSLMSTKFKGNLDETDIYIIRKLCENSNTPLACIGDELNVSPSTIHKRINRLVDGGVIERFTILFRPRHSRFKNSGLRGHRAGAQRPHRQKEGGGHRPAHGHARGARDLRDARALRPHAQAPHEQRGRAPGDYRKYLRHIRRFEHEHDTDDEEDPGDAAQVRCGRPKSG